MPETTPRSEAWNYPVLTSCAAASPTCTYVTVDEDAIEAVADWMSFEVFPPIAAEGDDPSTWRPDLERSRQIDFSMLVNSINFAYTDFDTKIPWSIVVDGHEYVDADGLRVRLEEAVASGVPVTTGQYLASLTEQQFAEIAHGPRVLPMIPERVAALNEVGKVLVERYDGSFSHLIESCSDLAFDDGNGVLERLIAEFDRFDDRDQLRGQELHFHKLAQLAVWMLHRLGLKRIGDLDRLATFAEYIQPTALRWMRVLHYSPELAAAVDAREVIPRSSEWEVEIRVQTVYAIARLTDALNDRRMPRGHERLTNPQVDYRFWSQFHDLVQPHHLTITTRY